MAEVDPGAVTRTLPSDAPPGPKAGDRVGRYVVERALGAGGMGVVVEARDPELQRQVALKLVRPDVGDRAYRLRLVREARAMAKLEHPNVVRVYDAGEVGGEVFVAMELVVGRSLGAWLRALRRPWREVLARFVAAGRGLAAAHAAGMVHRDFKPENVLVRDSDNSVCVTDFGLAVPSDREPRAEASAPATPMTPMTPISGDDETALGGGPSGDLAATPQGSTFTLTGTGVAVGTPPYMAPEQHLGAAVDARADIFSFCVSLYEGVYGERPFAVEPSRRHDPDAWADAIARGVRPAPAGRRVPAALRRALIRGLASDPAARWPSMEPLLAALTRVLTRRRRIAILASAVALVAAFAAVALFPRGAADATDPCVNAGERLAGVWDDARRASVRAHLIAIDPTQGEARFRAVAAALDRYARGWIDLHVDGCRAAGVPGTRSDLYDLRIACLERRRADLDHVVGRLSVAATTSTLDDAMIQARQLGDLADCADAQALIAAAPPPDPARRGEVNALRDEIDRAHRRHTDGDDAGEPAASQTRVARARALGHAPTLAAALDDLLSVQIARGQVMDVVATARELTEVAASAHNDRLAVYAWVSLISSLSNAGQKDEALALAQAGRAAVARTGDDPQLRALFLLRLAGVLGSTPRVDEALADLAEARRLLVQSGADQQGNAGGPIFADVLLQTADVTFRRGDYAAAVDLYHQAIAATQRLYGPDHPDLFYPLSNLAVALQRMDRGDESLASAREAVRVVEARQGESVLTARGLTVLASTLSRMGKSREAADTLARVVRIYRAEPGVSPSFLAGALIELADAEDELSDRESALAHDAEAIAVAERPGGKELTLAEALYDRATIYVESKRCAEALPDLRRAAEVFIAIRGATYPNLVYVDEVIGHCLVDLGRYAEAIEPLQQASAFVVPENAARLQITARFWLGCALAASGRDRGGGRKQMQQARDALTARGHANMSADDMSTKDLVCPR